MTAAPIVQFAETVLGFRLWPRQAAILAEVYAARIREIYLRLGRRSGKTLLMALIAVFEAIANADVHLAAVRPGEKVAIIIVAASRAQARRAHEFVRQFLRAPGLAGLVLRDTVDEIELRNGILIHTIPCHAGTARGSAAAVVIFDEAAWFIGADGSPFDPKELYDALVPGTAQFPAGKVVVSSTPRWASGWFADQCRLAAGGRFADLREWHATTAAMTPRSHISAYYLDRRRAMDPVAFRREYEASFEAGIGAVFDADLVRAALRARPPQLPAVPGTSYVMAVDPAFTGDTFALVIGHREASGRVVVDQVRGWAGSKANPVRLDTTLDEIAAYAGAYNRAPAVIDQYAAEPIRQGLRARGVVVRARPWTNESKVDAIATLRRVLYAGQLELPQHRQLVTELVDLEQRLLPSGRPRIAAPGGRHDDYASALMALVLELAARDRLVPTMDVDERGRIFWEYRPRREAAAPA